MLMLFHTENPANSVLAARNGSFYLLGIPEGPVKIEKILPFLQSQRSFKGSILGGRYILELMLEFAARHQIKAAIKEFPMVCYSYMHVNVSPC